MKAPIRRAGRRCCAPVASGQTTAIPPRPTMNSRRCMPAPKLRRRHPIGSNECLIGAANRPRYCGMKCWRMSVPGPGSVRATARSALAARADNHQRASDGLRWAHALIKPTDSRLHPDSLVRAYVSTIRSYPRAMASTKCPVLPMMRSAKQRNRTRAGSCKARSVA